MAGHASKGQRDLAVRMCERFAGPDGELSNALVRRIAEMTGVTPRTVRRWAAAPPTARPAPDLPSASDLEALALTHGNMKAAHRLRVAEGRTDSYTTYWRQVRRMQKGKYLGYRHGAAAVKDGTIQVRYDIGRKLGLGHFDHTEAPLEVEYRKRKVKPWITALIDDHTRFVVASAVTIGDGVRGDPPTETIKAILVSAAAGRDHDGYRYGGVFDAVMFDNAAPHLSEAIREGLGILETAPVPIRPGTPEHNGKVERFMWISELEMFANHYGFTHGNPDRWGRDKSLRELDGLLTLDAFIGLWAEFIDRYNHERVHSSLKCTPAEAWRADPTEPRFFDEEIAKRFFAGGDETVRKITKNGISFRGHWYVNTYELNTYWTPNTEDVRVRYLPNDHTFVDVYDLDDAYICRAHLSEYLPVDQQGASFKLRESVAHGINTVFKKSHARRKAEAAQHNALFAFEAAGDGRAADADEFTSFLYDLIEEGQ